MGISRSQIITIVIAAVFFMAPVREAGAQVAKVIVSGTRNATGATVHITVSANFKGASGATTFQDVQVSRQRAERRSVTKDGFVYTVHVYWISDDTIEANANVRSEYGEVNAVGRTKI